MFSVNRATVRRRFPHFLVPFVVFNAVLHICSRDCTERKLTPHDAASSRGNLISNQTQVCPGDFLYMERIGEGGFGRVWHVKKKSTGKHYAMKIQLKTALLDTFHDDPTRIDNER